MAPERRQLEPGQLRSRAGDTRQRALDRGALVPIPTSYEIVERVGVRFQLRVLESLKRKDEARRAVALAYKEAPRPAANPFLPYDEDLYVADVGHDHVALLNKYNVIDCHLLLVTRAFAHQEEWLDRADMGAAARCLAELDALVFYNGGEAAGASQPHKHLQLVPLPLIEGEPAVPLADWIAAAAAEAGIGRVPGLPFRHGVLGVDPGAGAGDLLESYTKLLRDVGLLPRDAALTGRQTAPYNLLLTRGWMMLVPRGAEFAGRISVNSLGFAGSLFVRDEAERQTVVELGPLEILRRVGVPL
ncbi:MAG: phosphorylase [Deltaproteobacteria bacterium]|jgi:ATP adenylyltransferase|nr:phosphorylase [Deltaproteobacteria bacterium]